MNLDPELLKQLMATFKVELEEQTQQITDGLLKLENGVKDTEEKIKIIETIFRAAHNIKGASRSLGINDVGEIAHRIETLFSKMKQSTITMTADKIDLCLEAVDKMHISMKAFMEKAPLNFDLPDLLSRLDTNEGEKIANRETPKNTVIANESEKTANKETPKNTSIENKSEKIANKETPKNTPIENKSEKIASKETPKNTVIAKEAASVAENKFSPEPEVHESIRVSIEKIDKVFALLEEIQINKIAIEDYYTKLSQMNSKMKELSYLWKQIITGVKSHQTFEYNDSISKLYDSANDNFLEVSHSAANLQKSMRIQLNELSILSNSLQEEVRMLRLVPAGDLLRSFPRHARDLAHQLNKEVELTIQGDEVRMDKLVLEGLKDPLMHIIRNAIDHGIENPDIRQANGKARAGHIHMNVIDEGSQIFIKISDDGGGIDIKKISSFIEEKKLATSAELEKMNDNEILEFIFRSGFSTKNIITDISGRGVGLDVVKSNLIELKGNVTVDSKLGQETTFTLSVPLTLSSERGLLTSSGEQLFVIPTNSVKRVLVIQPKDIVDVEGNQTLLIDEHPIPLRVLSDILSLTTQQILEKEKLSVVVIEKGRLIVALLVDEIIGEREIVIKPLRAPLANVRCVSGGTLLEHNQVAVVLNASDLLEAALHITSLRRLASQDKSTETIEKPHILVVDDSITTRTLEKNILESKNYQVTITVNGKEAWDILQKQKFALMITDVTMPIMDGFTLTEKVKKSEKIRDMPVIIVTSLGSDAEKARGVEVGANAYIIKSEFESGALLDIVAQLV